MKQATTTTLDQFKQQTGLDFLSLPVEQQQEAIETLIIAGNSILANGLADCSKIATDDDTPAPTGVHTATPWESFPELVKVAEPQRGRVVIRSISGYRVVVEDSPLRWDQALIDYAFIVKAVNNHDALVAALRDMLDLWERSQSVVANAQLRNIEHDSQVVAARAALNAVEQEEEDSDAE